MKILIADDHAVLRQGLRQILADEFSEAELGETGSTQETLDLLAEGEWDLVILDIFMPGRSGLEVLRAVRQHQPRLPVLVLSSAPEEQMALRVLKAGARGYLTKQTAPEQLVQAVGKVLSGGSYISPALGERLAKELSSSSTPPHEQLSDREFQVMRLVVAGNSLKQIAAELSLSVKTVSTFHTRVWEKLRVHNDVELVHYAIEHGLVEGRS